MIGNSLTGGYRRPKQACLLEASRTQQNFNANDLQFDWTTLVPTPARLGTTEKRQNFCAHGGLHSVLLFDPGRNDAPYVLPQKLTGLTNWHTI